MTRTAHHSDEFDDIRLEALTNFRCQRCNIRFPNTPEFLVIQDGVRLCRPNCATTFSPSETQLIDDMAQKEAAELYTSVNSAALAQLANAPNWSLMDGVSALTDITFTVDGAPFSYPTPLPLYPDGSIDIVVLGVGFTDSDTITFNIPHVPHQPAALSISTPLIAADRTSFTTTVSASTLCSSGDYDLLFNSSIYRNAVRVRASAT